MHLRVHSGHTKAYLRVHYGHPRAYLRVHSGHPRAYLRVHSGHLSAYPRVHSGHPRAYPIRNVQAQFACAISAHDIYVMFACYYWPGLSNPGQYSVAFHFRDWGRDLDMQINDFRVTLRASPVSARRTDLSAEANFHTSPEQEGIFSRYVFLLYSFVYLSCNTLCCSTTSFVLYITIINTTNNLQLCAKVNDVKWRITIIVFSTCTLNTS